MRVYEQRGDFEPKVPCTTTEAFLAARKLAVVASCLPRVLLALIPLIRLRDDVFSYGYLVT